MLLKLWCGHFSKNVQISCQKKVVPHRNVLEIVFLYVMIIDLLIIIDYHWLSLIIIDYHWLSLIIIDYHWLSLIIIYYHWLSLINDDYWFIYYHWFKSLIIIYYHWLSLTYYYWLCGIIFPVIMLKQNQLLATVFRKIMIRNRVTGNS